MTGPTGTLTLPTADQTHTHTHTHHGSASKREFRYSIKLLIHPLTATPHLYYITRVQNQTNSLLSVGR